MSRIPRIDWTRIDWDLLSRYQGGTCTAEESQRVAQWLAESPDHAALLRALPVIGTVGDRTMPPEGKKALAAALRQRPGIGVPGFTMPRRSRWLAFAAAAAAAIVAVVGVRIATHTSKPSPSAAPRTYATTVGQRGEVRLPDGTQVMVAPESRLRLAADFGRQRRDIYLEGEAYFEVVHDSARPFTVFTANASTRDLGTAFAIRGYSEERTVRVVVREGRVAMSGAGLLAAGDVGRLAADGQATVRHHANVDALLGWTKGELAFQDAPLGQVLRDLRRWYGLDTDVSDSSLAALPFTGSLRGLTPDRAVQVVASTLGLQVRQDGSRAVLVRR
jgi:transmembrane sensor